MLQSLAKMSRIFVACKDCRVVSAVKRLVPDADVSSVEVDKETELVSGDGKKLIEDQAEILLAEVPVILDVVYSAKQLKWAESSWAGVEKLLAGLKKDQPPSCLLTRCGGAFNQIMAEYVLGYIIAKERSIIQMADSQKECAWNRNGCSDYRSITELTLGILGVGEIGSAVARLCQGAGMTVIGVNRSIPDKERRCSAVKEYITLSDLPSALSQCDYVCSVLPSTPETQGLLSGDMFSHCQTKKSVFINIGRGDVTDDQSLVKAIRNGWLGGAVLDVFPEEPLPSDSPLWTLPGVNITPHIAGVSLPNQVAQSFVNNYQLFCDKQPLKFQVDMKKGY